MKPDNRSRISSIRSEWEDSVLFDSDDPDFLNSTASLQNSGVQSTSTTTTTTNATASNTLQNLSTLLMKVPSTMSLADLQNSHLAELCNSIGHNSLSGLSLSSSSLSEFGVGSPFDMSTESVITIEDLRNQMGSCFTCGVSWTDDHVSLDCAECGGYSCERPCPLCDGNCGIMWKRDFTMSHACGKARWQGVCPTFPDFIHNHLPVTLNHHHHHHHNHHQVTPQLCGASQLIAQELCTRLEQLSASAQT